MKVEAARRIINAVHETEGMPMGHRCVALDKAIRENAINAISDYKMTEFLELLCDTERAIPVPLRERCDAYKHYMKRYKKESLEAVNHIRFLYRSLDRIVEAFGAEVLNEVKRG
jgi:hypothetical protein